MNTLIIKKLYSFIITAFKNIYTDLQIIVLPKSLYFISNQSTAIWKPCFQWLYKCLLLIAAFNLMSTDTIYITFFSFVCTLCTVDNSRFTRGIVKIEASTHRILGETRTDMVANKDETRTLASDVSERWHTSLHGTATSRTSTSPFHKVCEMTTMILRPHNALHEWKVRKKNLFIFPAVYLGTETTTSFILNRGR